MYQKAELVMRSYKPLYLEKGMLFFRKIWPGSDKETLELWELEHPVYEHEEDVFLAINGYPMELFVADVNREGNSIIASPHEIGWFDESEQSEDLHDITLKEINTIFNDHQGEIEIDLREEGVPEYVQQKVVIRFPQEEE